MTETANDHPVSPATRRRAAVLLVVAAILAGLAASFTRVPEGHHAFRRLRGDGEWTVLEPGLRLHLPFLHEFHTSSDEVTVRRTVALQTASGGEVTLDYAVTARLTEDALRRGAARALTPEDYLAANAEEILASAGRPRAGEPPGGLAGILEAELGRRGFADLIVTAGAGSGEAPASRRTLDHPIVVIGLDGADWQVAEPLMAEGRVPALSRLRAEGAWGHLRSSMPLLSPLLWTTAATGKGPDQHGIVDFLVPDPSTGKKLPISSSFRRVKALWNIFGDRGLFSSFVAWWATFPAEPIRGEIISDRVAYSLFDVGGPEAAGSGLVHPPALWPAIRDRIVGAAQITDAQVQRLARVDPGRIAAARDLLSRREGNASKDRLVHLMKILASTRTYHRIALDRIQAGQPDLLGIYYQGIDEISHRFAHCAPPAMDLCPPEDAARFGETVAAFYEYQDQLLGEILDAVDPDSYVMVLSDHGFRNGGDRPGDVAPDIDGKPAKWHRLYGIVLVRGPGIDPGRLDNVTLLEIAPTVLSLAGLPRAEDMPGRPLVEPEGAAGRREVIASYEGGQSGLAVASAGGPGASQPSSSSTAGEAAMMENLRSLGYIGDDDAPAVPPVAAGGGPAGPAGSTPGTVTAHTNVGALHLQKGDLDRAEREFQAALKIVPQYLPALMGMTEVRVQQGRLEEAFAYSGRALRTPGSPEPGVYIRYASLATRTGAAAQAASTLESLKGSRPEVAEVRVALALLAEDRADTAAAEAQLLEALRIDPASAEAMSRLFRMRRREGREAGLEGEIRKALRINAGSVLHHNWLGLILQRRGETRAAESEFKEALRLAPDFGGTMANLGSLYGRVGRLEEAVEVLSRALEIEPRNLECRVNLGAALGKLGRTDEALALLLEGRAAAPKSPEILNALAVTYAQKGDTARAGALFRESLEIRADQPKVREMLRELEGGS